MPSSDFGALFCEQFHRSLLNEKYRVRLEAEGKSESEIVSILRKGSSKENPKTGRTFVEKFTDWPSLISGKEVEVPKKLQRVLSEFNQIRGNLTHPKSRGHEIYDELETTDPQYLFESVAEYAITIFTSLGERYPYWLFGWNYLNPDRAGCDPLLINDQQFLHSLNYLGLNVPSYDADAAHAWKETHLKSFQSL